MIFKETKIPDLYNNYIVSVYNIQCSNPMEHKFYVPDGNLELMLINQPVTIFSRTAQILTGQSQIFWGQKRFTGTIEATKDLKVYGIKFQPWLFPFITKQRQVNLVDSILPLPQVLSDALIDKIGVLFENWDFSNPNYTAIQDLSLAISNGLNSNLLVKPNFKEMLNELRLRNGVCSIADLQKIYKQSARTLEYDFKKYIGLKPKEYQNIIRFRKSCMALKKNKNIFHTAIDFGYYDQSHFTNHFIKNCLKSPKTFLNEKNLLLSTA